MSAIDVAELIARPLDVIARLRVELRARGNSGSGEEESVVLTAAISETLCSGASPALERVPILCRDALVKGKLAANSLVRYRGMVQDQYEPEYFVGSFQETETATGKRERVDVKYVDSIVERPGFVNEFEGPDARTMERLPLYCIPVPGQSKWATRLSHEEQQQQQQQQQEEEEVEEEEDAPPVDASASGGLQKRHREQAQGEEDAMDCTDENADISATSGDSGNGAPQLKAPRAATNLPKSGSGGKATTNSSGSGSISTFHHGQELDLAGLACLVKVYDFGEGQIKLNDTLEFVGVLGYDQGVACSQEDGDVSMGGEEAAEPHKQQQHQQHQQQQELPSTGNPFHAMEDFSRKVPPPSLAPRLHCVFHRKLPPSEPLPVDPDQPQSAIRALLGPLPLGEFMRDAKAKAMDHLKRALRGDALAAEYALLALLSRVYVRTESSAPGSLSVNLRGVSADEAPGFHAAVSDLVPKCVRVPVTTKSLSEKFKFSPKKDYEADRLMMSSLQLSDGTVVVLDETTLEPGQVGEEGVGNLAALGSLVSLQKVPYDFGFYKMDFPVDHPTVSLSLRGSIVPFSAVVPVVPATTSAVAAAAAGGGSGAIPTVSPEEMEGEGTGAGAEEEGAGQALVLVLERLRVYVEATRRTSLTLDEASSALAEEDFVKDRQEGHAVTAEDFHRMLTIARLTALSLGDTTVTAEHWSHMKSLEASVSARKREMAGATGVAGRRSTSSTSASEVPAAANTAAVGATPISPCRQAGPLNSIPEND